MSVLLDQNLMNFFIEIRNSLISRDNYQNVNALISIIKALDYCNNNNSEERAFVINNLCNLDFLTHFNRFIISRLIYLKLTMKITLIITESDYIKEDFIGLLKSHFRAFIFLSRDRQNINLDVLKDCFIFIEIMQER